MLTRAAWQRVAAACAIVAVLWLAVGWALGWACGWTTGWTAA